ncbi:MAG: TIGR03862 family flavoprotein [Pseudorhodoplanes sp.]
MGNTSCAVIGSGPAGLMAAERIARAGFAVTVYEAMPSPGRKFLMAGRGGLNLTHSEDLPQFLSRYREAESNLRPAIETFSPRLLRDFSLELGEQTFIGSSGRVFPKAMKASPLLRAWLKRLDAAGVRIATRHRWRGWDADGALLFETPDGERHVAVDAAVLALGGGSWPKLGSDGAWVEILRAQGIEVRDLRSANCGFVSPWSELFRNRFEGAPLKRVALTFARETVRGEIVITQGGLEGVAVYALSHSLREAIENSGEALLSVDLMPDMTQDDLARRLEYPRGKNSLANYLRKVLSLSSVAIGLAQEGTKGKLAGLGARELAATLKNVPIRLTATAPIARAISSAGGVPFGEVDRQFMLRKIPGVFVAGEMLDWEAPTGGYLLQASFATGAAAGEGAAAYLAVREPEKTV